MKEDAGVSDVLSVFSDLAWSLHYALMPGRIGAHIENERMP